MMGPRSPRLSARLAAILLFAAPVAAAAQSPATGEIGGTVVSTTGQALPDVFVTATNEETGLVRRVESGRRGIFRIPLLPPGAYTLHFERLSYAPRILTHVPVEQGARLGLEVALSGFEAAGDPVPEPYDGRLVGATAPAAGQYVPTDLAAEVPLPRHEVLDLARFLSVASTDLAVEGLPPWLSAFSVDGTPFRPAVHPAGRTDVFRSAGFSVSSVGGARLLTNDPDVEWSGAAGGMLAVNSIRGTPRFTGRARGHWSGDVIPGTSFNDAAFTDLQAGFAARGPLGSDSARVSFGLDLRKAETPLAPAWMGVEGAEQLAAVLQNRGVATGAFQEGAASQADALAGFARLDWALGERQRVAAWAQAASLPAMTVVDPRTGTLPELEGGDMLAGASLISSLGEGSANDLRVSFTSSRRALDGPLAPLTTFVTEGASVGDPAGGTVRAQHLRVSDALHLGTGAHQIKLGAEVALASHRQEAALGPDAAFAFSGAGAFTTGRGASVATEGLTGVADWSSPLVGLFVQDRWAAGRGLDIVLGLRVDGEWLPSEDVRLDTEWLSLSGRANNAVDGASWRPAARVGLFWDVDRRQEWLLSLAAGIYNESPDPLVLGRWLRDTGTARVVRQVGAVEWPEGGAGSSRPRLTVLDGDFEGPTTTRLSAGVARRLGETTALRVSAVVRRTEALPRRTDLNLLAFASAEDQYGRPVYGTLAKEGAVLAATPGTGRQFGPDSYDEVALVSSDGFSDYWGITAGVDHDLGPGAHLLARYTFSSTTDDWYEARLGGWTVARPALGAGDTWAEGTSDFDTPHRAVVGVALDGPFDTRVSGLYRMESGPVFTPGFRAGVDANADGVAGNDPAFVDASLDGMNDVMAAWSCLRDSSGGFAERNSCRGEAVHSVDLSVAWGLPGLGDLDASVVLDVFDLLEANRSIPDPALYLVDPAAPLQVTGSRVTVPLVVNPRFGEALAIPYAGRTIRLGISLNW